MDPTTTIVFGHCAPNFAEVRRVFERNFLERDELGSGVCVIHEGQTAVDLWGGSMDAAGERPWLADTMVIVFSCTKGATALCAHVLASQGELDLDARVSRYWPRFACNGKEDITVRMLLNHQAGLPGISKVIPTEVLCDFEAMAAQMESERPMWRPGSCHGYHGVTFGWLVGEVIRRVAGDTVGGFLREAVTEPLGIDFWIGLPEQHESRVATTIVGADSKSLSPRFDAAVERGEPVQVGLVNSVGTLLDPGGCDARAVHAAEIPAANGIASARGLAGMYAPLAAGGESNGVTLVDAAQLVEMGAIESASAEDAVTFEPSRFSAGFEKSGLRRCGAPLVFSEAAFGHSGHGGALGFADPQAGLAFGYAMNRHEHSPQASTTRCQALIDATYASLGYHSRDDGRWT